MTARHPRRGEAAWRTFSTTPMTTAIPEVTTTVNDDGCDKLLFDSGLEYEKGFGSHALTFGHHFCLWVPN